MFELAHYLIEFKNGIGLITLPLNQTEKQTFFNFFDDKKQKWSKELKIEEKFKNFNNMTLIMASKYGNPYSYIEKLDGSFRGIVIDITKIVAERGNFSFQVASYHDRESWKNLYSVAHFEFALNVQWSAFFNFAHCTSTFKSSNMVFEMTPPEKFSNWEKVLLPFDEETWKFLLITFGVAFSSVFVINQMPKLIKNLVFGENVSIPAYNIVGTFFGIGQLKLPEGNFARILLMIFILFCLVVRTAYQGEFCVNIKRTLLNLDPF
jgi:hypothetical protein